MFLKGVRCGGLFRVHNQHHSSSDRILFRILSSELSLIGIFGSIFETCDFIIIVLLNLLILFGMQGIKKYRMFGSAKELFLRRARINWARFFRIGSFVRVLSHSEAYINLKFTGICTKKSFRGIGATFILVNRMGLKYKYFVFMPTIVRLVLVHF